jgi:hypothetical protein
MAIVNARTGGFLIALAAAFLMTGDAFAEPDHTKRPRVLTYEQAKAEGIVVGPLPSETGLPTCDSMKPDPGFESAEEAARTINEAEAIYGEDGPNRCAADPRLGVYAVDFPKKGPWRSR